MPSGDGFSGERIRALRESLGIKGIDLAQRIGISGPYLSEIERGVKSPSLPILSKIAEALGVKPSDLMGDSPISLVSLKGKREISEGEGVKFLRDYVLCPVLTDRMQICAGEGFVLYDAEGSDVHEYIPIQRSDLGGADKPKKPFIVKVQGDSMEPKVHNGDKVLVNPNLEVRNGDVGVVCWMDRWALKIVHYRKDGLILSSFNPDNPDIPVSREEMDNGLLFFGGRVLSRVAMDPISGV